MVMVRTTTTGMGKQLAIEFIAVTSGLKGSRMYMKWRTSDEIATDLARKEEKRKEKERSANQGQCHETIAVNGTTNLMIALEDELQVDYDIKQTDGVGFISWARWNSEEKAERKIAIKSLDDYDLTILENPYKNVKTAYTIEQSRYLTERMYDAMRKHTKDNAAINDEGCLWVDVSAFSNVKFKSTQRPHHQKDQAYRQARGSVTGSLTPKSAKNTALKDIPRQDNITRKKLEEDDNRDNNQDDKEFERLITAENLRANIKSISRPTNANRQWKSETEILKIQSEEKNMAMKIQSEEKNMAMKIQLEGKNMARS
ncbi:hypothetical protein BC829DRAFT_441858 [Chytridium lagenaria]|nr:hypothetical protein BC829DRAFT_441858 [Chytridium lagenaria]